MQIGGFGGTEVKQVIIAKALFSSYGHHITFLAHDYGQQPRTVYDGIRIIKTFPYENEIKKGGFYRSIIPVWKGLKMANADIYFKRAAGPMTGIIALYCKLYKKVFIYAAASSYDVDGGYLTQVPWRDRFLHKFGFKECKKIILQTREYRDYLNNNMKSKSLYIPDAFEIPKNNKIVSVNNRKYFLFIGAMRPVKRPEIFIDLANKFPKHKFLMIGGPLADLDYYNSIKRQAEKVKNIEFIGHVSRNKIATYIAKAIALINTSEREGLPNTVTEAWSYGVPVIGLNINPDGLIEKFGYFCNDNNNKLAISVEDILNNKVKYGNLVKMSREYVKKYHKIDKTISLYNKVINEN